MVNAHFVGERARLIMHRMIARQIGSDPSLIERARVHVEAAVAEAAEISYLVGWQRLLAMDIPTIRRRITERNEEMQEMRHCSPLSVLVDFKDIEFRRRIWRKARMGAVTGEIAIRCGSAVLRP